MVFLLKQVLQKAPEHDTVIILSNSGAQKKPWSIILVAFFLIQALKKAPEQETVGIL